MVGRWGMSDTVGPIAVLPADEQGPLLPAPERDRPLPDRHLDGSEEPDLECRPSWLSGVHFRPAGPYALLESPERPAH